MNKKIVAALFCILLGACFFIDIPVMAGAALSGDDFLALKSSGQYRKALQKIGSGSADDRACELDLLRVLELEKYPDLNESIADALNRISVRAGTAANPVLRARLDQARWSIMLKKGDIGRAGKLVGKYGYLDFEVAGPFECSGLDSFERRRGPETDGARSKFYQGKYGRVFWFTAEPDRSGAINMGDLLRERADEIFYLSRDLDVRDAGEYEIILGKTGYTDVYLDGSPVFSSRAGHDFMHDQFGIRVKMESGRHSILVKTGYSGKGTVLSVRIADASGVPSFFPRPSGESSAAASSLVRAAPYTMLASGSDTPEDRFMKGMFCFVAGLVSDEEREAQSCFESIDAASPYYSASLCHLASIESDDGRALDLFRRSFDADRANLEAGIGLMRQKLRLKQFQEAYGTVTAMAGYAGSSPLYMQAMAEYFAARKWDLEARRWTSQLERFMPCEAARIEAGMYGDQGDYAGAADAMLVVLSGDRYDPLIEEKYIEICGRSGRTVQAEKALREAVVMHPSAVRFRMHLARAMSGRAEDEAISCLTSALAVSPFNAEVLSALAREYRSRGKDDLAAHYLRMAIDADPENSSLKRAYDLLASDSENLSKYMERDGIASLKEKARQFGDEPAVVLLDESVTWLSGAGSQERRVRKIVQVNDDSVSDEFSVQYAVFSPETEKIENISCILWKNGSPRTITERYAISLSDPESRLYYDLSALVIPVSGISAGDILDFSYTVRTSCGDDGCGEFGRALVLGGKYRIIDYNHVVAVSRSKKVYCHMVVNHARQNENGVERKPPEPVAENDRLVYRIRKSNLQPNREEPGMPDESDFIPSIVFTSFSSWDELCGWYRSLLSGRKIVSDEMKAAVRSLTKGVRDPDEKARRIYNHVASEIRYVGFEFGMGGIRPRRTDLTYASRMGDCKDMALVLEAMIEEAGLDADLALVRTYDNGSFDQAAPFIGFFNHAVCCVHLDRPLILDATADYSGFKDLPEGDRGVAALVIGEKRWRFIGTDAAHCNPNAVIVDNRIRLDGDGGAVIARKLVKKGPSAMEIRAGMANPGKKARSVAEYWNRRFPGAKIDDLKAGNMDVDTPAEYSYDITAPSMCEKAGSDLIVPSYLSFSGLFDAYTMISRRESPLLLSESGTTEITSVFQLPDGYEAYRIPENETFTHPGFSASFTCQVKDGSIVVHSMVDIRQKRIDRDLYSAFRDFAAFINRKEREKIILCRKAR